MLLQIQYTYNTYVQHELQTQSVFQLLIKYQAATTNMGRAVDLHELFHVYIEGRSLTASH